MGSSRPIVAILLVLAVVIVAAFVWRRGHREGLLWAPFPDGTPVPGDPDRNILRRSRPPPGFPQDGLSSYYFQTDPARDSSYEFDFCEISPAACGGIRA